MASDERFICIILRSLIFEMGNLIFIWRFFIYFSRFVYICLYKADNIVYNYQVVLLRDAVVLP